MPNKPFKIQVIGPEHLLYFEMPNDSYERIYVRTAEMKDPNSVSELRTTMEQLNNVFESWERWLTRERSK